MSRFIYEIPPDEYGIIDDEFVWEKRSYLDKLEDRFKRIGDHRNMEREFATKRRPLLLMFHHHGPMDLFQKWTDVGYELADPDHLGKEMDFYVDNYVHLLGKPTSFIRGSDGCTFDRAPLIYGVTTEGEVHFFDRVGEPEEPNKEALLDFCQMVINGVRIYPNVEDIDKTRWNEIINSSDEDIVIFLYRRGFKPYMDSFYRLGVLLKKDSVRVYTMNIDKGGVPINFPELEDEWDMFFVKSGQRDNPVPYHRMDLYKWSMLQFVAKHTENELLFCDGNGVKPIHGDLIERLESTLYIYEDSTDTTKFSNRVVLYFLLMYKYIYNGDGCYIRIER